MTKEDIIRMAREAGLWPTEERSKEYGIPTPNEQWLPELERFADLVAKAERKRICDMLRDRHAKEERHNYYLFIARMIEESA
jgi:hypothetical protein